MLAWQFCASATAESGGGQCQWSALGPPVALAAVRSGVVVLLMFIRCCVLLPLCDSVVVLCFVVRCFVSVLVLPSSRWGRESWLL